MLISANQSKTSLVSTETCLLAHSSVSPKAQKDVNALKRIQLAQSLLPFLLALIRLWNQRRAAAFSASVKAHALHSTPLVCTRTVCRSNIGRGSFARMAKGLWFPAPLIGPGVPDARTHGLHANILARLDS